MIGISELEWSVDLLAIAIWWCLRYLVMAACIADFAILVECRTGSASSVLSLA